MSHGHGCTEVSPPPQTRELMASYELSVRQGLVLACLSEHGGKLGLTDLTHCFGRHVHRTQPGSIPITALQRIHCQLASTILRELERKALVEYCEKEGIVTTNTPM